uniref:Ribonuclease H-like domain-containing protein n=1 Tax=Tanacetum cinerariifolium TaxID=118510 RepID=A0A6L2NAE2_TANCI|nr:ribonuclease H-like domain-containing protein [Tanacetum cinerariifolium]
MKRTGRDHDGRVIILPPTIAEEHIAVQRESKERTTLLQSIPDDHVADFHYMNDAKDIWNAIKARFGGNAESKKMRKSMLKQEFLEFGIDDEDINLKFLRALPSLWSQMSKDTILFPRANLQDQAILHLLVLSVLAKRCQIETVQIILQLLPTMLHQTLRLDNVIEDVLQSFVADTEPEQLAYEDFEQIEKLDLEEMDLKWFNKKKVRCYKCQQRGHFTRECREKGGNDKQRYSSFKIKEIGKKEEDSKALITVDTLVDWTDHDDESAEVITAKKFGIFAGCDSEDAIKEGATKIYNLITGANSKEANTAGDAGEFALMGVTFKLTLEDKISVMSIELENTSNLLKHSERINADFETAKKDLQTKLDNHLVQAEKWRNSSKNLFRLIDSSMFVRTKVGLGFTNCIRENKLGWDDSVFSVFTTNSEDVEGRPIFHRFAKTDSMKAVPPPLSEDYHSLSDHIDLGESQMSYDTKSSTSCNSKSVSNDFVSCDDSDKSLEVNTNDFASSYSSVKSSVHQPNDSTSYALTSSVSTSVNEAEIESNDFFATHLIKDCDFHEKQMANKTVGIGVGPVYNRNKVNYRSQFVPQAVLLRTGKVNIPLVRPQPIPTGKPKVSTLVPTGKPKVSTSVPTGKPKVSTPVPTGRPNRPSPFPTDRGFSPSEHPFSAAEDEGIFNSGCSRSMTGRIIRKGTIRTPTLDFENVYYVKELQQFNLFSISYICDKKNQVLFTDTEYLVLSKDFKLSDDSMVVLSVPRKHNLYTINLHNLCPRGNLACLVAHALFDKSVKWHRRMGHVNYKNMNRLVKGNLVRGLPPKLFKNNHTCVACCKGKQHKASYKAIHATIKPSGGMTCQGVRKEMQSKGVIGDSIHFDALGDMQEFVKMLVGVFTWQTMKLAGILDLLNHVILQSKVRCLNSNRGNWATLPFKDGWHNSSIVWRSGTGGSPFPSATISKSFKRVGSARDLLRIVS